MNELFSLQITLHLAMNYLSKTNYLTLLVISFISFSGSLKSFIVTRGNTRFLLSLLSRALDPLAPNYFPSTFLISPTPRYALGIQYKVLTKYTMNFCTCVSFLVLCNVFRMPVLPLTAWRNSSPSAPRLSPLLQPSLH